MMHAPQTETLTDLGAEIAKIASELSKFRWIRIACCQDRLFAYFYNSEKYACDSLRNVGWDHVMEVYYKEPSAETFGNKLLSNTVQADEKLDNLFFTPNNSVVTESSEEGGVRRWRVKAPTKLRSDFHSSKPFPLTCCTDPANEGIVSRDELRSYSENPDLEVFAYDPNSNALYQQEVERYALYLEKVLRNPSKPELVLPQDITKKLVPFLPPLTATDRYKVVLPNDNIAGGLATIQESVPFHTLVLTRNQDTPLCYLHTSPLSARLSARGEYQQCTIIEDDPDQLAAFFTNALQTTHHDTIIFRQAG